jgi:hypothetical protein
VKGDKNLTIMVCNEVEHKHWCYALDITVAKMKKDATKTIVPPPHYPIHSGYLLCMNASMTWKRKYVVLTEDSLFINEDRRVGFVTPPLRFPLVSASCFFLTNLLRSILDLSMSVHLPILNLSSARNVTDRPPDLPGPKRNDIQNLSERA